MHDPDMYDTYSQFQRRDAQELVPYIVSKLKDGRKLETVLDLGCGTGYNTKNVILPCLATKGLDSATKVYGLDVSRKMVDFATLRYGHPNVTYMVADVMKEQAEFPCTFDLILSLHVLHWIPHHEKMMNRLYGLLKPKGEVGFYYIANAAVFSVYHAMSTLPLWASYLTDVKNFIPRSYFSKDPAKDMQDLMVSIGFVVTEAKNCTRCFCFNSFEEMIDSAMAANPFVHRIPADLKDAYKADFRDCFTPLVRHVPSKSSPDAIEVDYKIVLVRAQKD